MNWGAIGIVILMVVLYLFIVLFPRRPKYFYSDKAMLREDAEIIRVGSFGEGSRKERRIRTVVVFDDSFTYSACKDFRSGFFTIATSNEQQMEIVNAALKKHKQIIDSLSKQGELTLNPYDDLDEYQKEVVEYACNLLEMRILSKKELLKRVPDNPFIKREIQEVEYNLYKLRHGDIELIEEYTEVYEKDKQRKLDDMISHIESAIESCQEVKKNPEWYKPGNKTIEEFNSLCEINLKQLNENLLRLKAGDYELCKELEHDQREA